MDPKQLIKVCLHCVLVSKCHLTIQNELLKQDKTKQQQQKNPQTKQNIKTHRKNRNNPEKPSELK